MVVVVLGLCFFVYFLLIELGGVGEYFVFV